MNNLEKKKSVLGKIRERFPEPKMSLWLFFLWLGLTFLMNDMNANDFFEGFSGAIKLLFVGSLWLTLAGLAVFFQDYYKKQDGKP